MSVIDQKLERTVRLTVGALILIAHMSALADWREIELADPVTDEVRQTALVRNSEGHSFSIYRGSPARVVWGSFVLSENQLDKLDFVRPPVYRIDENEPHELALSKQYQELAEIVGSAAYAYEWQPRSVKWMMWHGSEEKGVAPALLQLMTGRRVVFRYWLPAGTHKDTSFTLAKSATAISSALDISAPPSDAIAYSPQVLKAMSDFRKAADAATRRCVPEWLEFLGSGELLCIKRVNDCASAADNDIAVLRSCLGQ